METDDKVLFCRKCGTHAMRLAASTSIPPKDPASTSHTDKKRNPKKLKPVPISVKKAFCPSCGEVIEGGDIVYLTEEEIAEAIRIYIKENKL